MSDSKTAPVSLELLTEIMNELARQIGFLDPDDPKRAPLVKGLSDLTHNSGTGSRSNQSVNGWMSLPATSQHSRWAMRERHKS